MSLFLSASIGVLGTGDGHATLLPSALRQLAVRADRAGLDFLVLHEPADALIAASWLIPLTRQMGLVCCIPAAHSQPFHTARALAAMDTLSGGRMGWLPTIDAQDETSPAYGPQAPLPSAAAAAKATEYIAATQALWDSWDANALIIDKQSAVYLDSAKIRRIDFRGEYFRVMGPLNAARPTQGYPVLIARDDSALRPLPRTADVVIVGAATPAAAQTRIAALRAEGAARIVVRVSCVSSAAVRAESADAKPAAPASGRSAAAATNAAAGAALPAVGAPARIAELLLAWHRELRCDGFHMVFNDSAEQLAALLEQLLPQLGEQGITLHGVGDDGDAGSRDGARALGGGASGGGGSGDGACGTLRARLGLPIPLNRYSSP